jgi:hypothetical protein
MPSQRRRGVFIPKQADKRMVPVVLKLAGMVEEGRWEWGKQYLFPAMESEVEAQAAVRSLYRARGPSGLSIQAGVEPQPDGTFRPWTRIWTREQGKQEVVRRVQRGEPLAYNLRRNQLLGGLVAGQDSYSSVFPGDARDRRGGFAASVYSRHSCNISRGRAGGTTRGLSS